MGKVQLLDCTLRDGGYINNWEFGEAAIKDIICCLENTGVDILEVGFLKNEPYKNDRTVFNDIKQVSPLINKNKNLLYAAMIEVVNPLPIEQLANAEEADVDIIRVIVWKRMLEEGFNYCKEIVKKGYKLCIQPARVDQYSDEEFKGMIDMFNALKPYALYVVDSWGTQSSKSLMHYMKLADKTLESDVKLGYHGHNNLLQAYQVAVDFIKEGFERELLIDASVYGIGRGAGNLNLELIARFMNSELEKNFNVNPMIEVYSKYLRKIYEKNPWGFSMAHYITAINNCNPDFGEFYDKERKIAAMDIEAIISEIPKEERIIFSKEKASRYEEKYFQNN